MIYTVTFNPALDYVMRVENFTPNMVNRTISEEIFCGGKGINVSIVLSNLGVDNVALGFVAGFTGDEIERSVKNKGVKTDFIHLKEGNSRINVKIKNKGLRRETDFNGQGPQIDKESIKKLFEKIQNLNENDIMVLAGSIPAMLPYDIYQQIFELIIHKNVKVVVDATKDLVLNVLKYKPFLIKPNLNELEEMFDTEIKTHEDVIKYAKELQKRGAVNVLVSMAGEGSILVDENGNVSKMGVAKGAVKNSVGAGDSMVAGFLAGYLKKNDYIYAQKLGSAAGGATAFADDLATFEQIKEAYEML